MSVLLTGGAGFIGSHTAVEFLENGEDIVLLDNYSNASPDVAGRIREITGKDFPAYEADLLSETELRKVFSENNIESVVHFAGLKAVGESVDKPLEYYHNNVCGLISLCRVMREFGCKKMVFSSSATVYGLCPDIPYKEEYPLSATSPYGSTKVMIEKILEDLYAADKEWSISILRYFNPIGAHKSGLIGENPKGIPNNLVPFIGKVAAGTLPELFVYGGDYDTKDGTGVRDYIHVTDLARGHLDALRYTRGHTGAEAFNLGAGCGYSVLEVIEAYRKASGREIPYKVLPRRAGDIAEFYADPSKAKRILGWQTELSLEEMCADSWRFVSKCN